MPISQTHGRKLRFNLLSRKVTILLPAITIPFCFYPLLPKCSKLLSTSLSCITLKATNSYVMLNMASGQRDSRLTCCRWFLICGRGPWMNGLSLVWFPLTFPKHLIESGTRMFSTSVQPMVSVEQLFSGYCPISATGESLLLWKE